MLSIIIPAYNEENNIIPTVKSLVQVLRSEIESFEILIVNDNSMDQTEGQLKNLSEQFGEVRYLNNHGPNGFGFAIRLGLDHFKGDIVAIIMADASDDPKDILSFYREIQNGHDCVFGNRWGRKGNVVDYPIHKYVLNRIFNFFISLLFQIRYQDTTNAFKMYRREVIEGLRPFLSPHFNLTVELPLKVISRGYSYKVVPNSWKNRQIGKSNLKIKEMGSRYLFIVFYCFIEKWLSRGDYKKTNAKAVSQVMSK